MLTQSAGFLSLVALAVASPGLAHASTHTSARPHTVPPPGASIGVRSMNGTGCLPGSTDVRPSGDGGLDVTFRAFQVQQAAGTGAQRKQCLVTIAAGLPRGYTVGLESLRVGGQASLARGAVGTVGWQSWFVGQPPTAGGAPRTLTGPFSGNWELRPAIPTASIRWMPCRANHPLNISVQTLVRGTAPSRVATDTASFRFAWKRC